MGTNVVKFEAPNGNDTMQFRGRQQSVSTKHMCISGMKEYECQSLEELRRADYLAGRKVNTSAPTEITLFGQQRDGFFGHMPTGTTLFGQQQSGGLFGRAPTGTLFGQQQGASLFGQGLANPSGGIFTRATTSVSAFPIATTATTSLFGIQAASPESSGSIFSQTASQSEQQTTGIFGQQQSAAMASLPNIGASMTKQQHEHPERLLHQNPLNRTIDTGNTHNFGNDLKEQKLINANLENQALHAKVEKDELMPQGALENLELKAECRVLKDNAEQGANYQALEARMNEFPNMLLTEQQKQMMAQYEAIEAKLSTQNDKHQKQMEELESKNRMLEEKLRNVEFAEKENGDLEGKMEQLKDECSSSKKLPGLDVE